MTAPGGATGVLLTIPHLAFDTLADSSIGSLRLTTPSGSITCDSKAIDTINDKASGDITLTIKKTDTSSFSDKEKASIGNRPVYDLTVTSGGTTISDFGGGTATVSIPYTPASGEDVNAIVVYYINAPNCSYDAKTGTVTFSTYAVGYNAVSFKDVSDSAWYADYVTFLAARGIVGGNNGAFSPDASITRAEFVTIVARMSGDDLSGYKTSAFSDVSTDKWYFAAVQWAYENGVASGSGGKFNPNDTITRQDIAVMITRYAKEARFTLPKTNSSVTFTDSAKISSYAAGAVTTMQQAGIISGNNGNFTPTENVTRAQAVKSIALFLQEMLRD